MELNEWEQQVRANNAPSHENVVTTLKEAQMFVAEHKGKFDQVLVVFSRNDEESIAANWFNGGFRFSRIVFMLHYLAQDFINEMRGVPEDD